MEHVVRVLIILIRQSRLKHWSLLLTFLNIYLAA